MERSKNYYFGIHPEVLNPVSLEVSCFGAIWYEEDLQRYIVGYGFGPDQTETLSQFCRSAAYFTCSNTQVMYEIYRTVRDKQQEQDWLAHKRLNGLAAFKEPWKHLRSGWYVIRSRSTFPLHLSVVRKTKYGVWLEHCAVCENEAELTACLDRTKQAHHLKSIESAELKGGGIYG